MSYTRGARLELSGRRPIRQSHTERASFDKREQAAALKVRSAAKLTGTAYLAAIEGSARFRKLTRLMVEARDAGANIDPVQLARLPTRRFLAANMNGRLVTVFPDAPRTDYAPAPGDLGVVPLSAVFAAVERAIVDVKGQRDRARHNETRAKPLRASLKISLQEPAIVALVARFTAAGLPRLKLAQLGEGVTLNLSRGRTLRVNEVRRGFEVDRVPTATELVQFTPRRIHELVTAASAGLGARNT